MLAKKKGLVISFDTNIRPALWKNLEDAAKVLMPFIEQADILFTDLNDTKVLLGETNVDNALREYLLKGIGVVVLSWVQKGP